METPIGAVYSTNITPDRKTGIGDYSFEDFDRAVRHGVARSGDTLLPGDALPSYARVSEADMRALYAYFMHGVEPVEQPNKASDIPWPLSMRWPLAFWRWTFAPEVKDFQAAAGQDPVPARGAYLVEGLATVAPAIPRVGWACRRRPAGERWRGLPVRQRAAGELDRQEPARRPPDRTGQLERSRPGQLPAYRPQRAQRGVRRHVRRGGAQHAVHDRRRPHRHRPLPQVAAAGGPRRPAARLRRERSPRHCSTATTARPARRSTSTTGGPATAPTARAMRGSSRPWPATPVVTGSDPTSWCTSCSGRHPAGHPPGNRRASPCRRSAGG